MITRTVELAEVVLPEFVLPTIEPEIPAATYERRIERLRACCEEQGYEAFIVYGDGEHFANLTFLTGYDPRFEEALLIVMPNRLPTLVVGHEGLAYSKVSPVNLVRVLYPTFSLLSMPRSATPSLESVLQDAGIKRGMQIGMAGWKYFEKSEISTPRQWIEVPSFIVDTLREIGCEPVNATDILMHPSYGLRTTSDVDQLAVFEFAATHGSQSVRNMVFNIRPGMTEYQAVETMSLTGLPTAFHPIVLSGDRVSLAPGGPSSRKLKLGDPVIAALGYRGSNTARAGFLVEHANQLPSEIQDYIATLVVPYFTAIVAWYELVGIGVTGGELYATIHSYLGDPFFGVFLNPGHLIHLEEWVSSPVYEGSTQELRSGMALQVDVIPATGTRYFTTNIEDTIALADAPLREAFAEKYPDAWNRIQMRRSFVENSLNIRLKPEVLLFSNMPAYLPPFWLSPHQVMRGA